MANVRLKNWRRRRLLRSTSRTVKKMSSKENKMGFVKCLGDLWQFLALLLIEAHFPQAHICLFVCLFACCLLGCCNKFGVHINFFETDFV